MTRWRVVVLLLAGTLAAAVGYAGYNRIFAQGDSSQAPERLVVKARRGTLENTVSATGSLATPRQARLSFAASGTVAEVSVGVGDAVTEGQVLAKLETAPLERAVEQARANLSTAQINLEEAKNPYTASDIAAAEAAVRDAQVGLGNARRSLRIVQQGLTTVKKGGETVTTWRELLDLEDEVNWYEANHGQALIDYENGQIDKAELDRAWTNLVTAKQRLEEARLQHEISLATALNNVARAEDTLRRAEEALAEKRAGADLNTVAKKENDVVNRRAALEQALEQLEGAVIRAPFDAWVASVDIRVGDRTAAGKPVVTLMDLDTVEVTASVDEIDVAQVKPGQKAVITLDSLPEVTLRGQVLAVAPGATRQAGVVSYGVTISVEDAPGDLGLREGMTALASIVVERRENVLLVPSRAVKTLAGEQVVDVVTDASGRTQVRTVTTGASDGRWTEILSGLEEGEAVVVELPSIGSRQQLAGGLGFRRGMGLLP